MTLATLLLFVVVIVAQARLPEGRVHFSGCERRCGRPKGGYVDYLATGDGEYEVTSVD